MIPRYQVRASSPTDIKFVRGNDVEEVLDILSHLKFTDDIQRANEEHPGLQAYFECVAAESAGDLQCYEEITFTRWWAHHRLNARHYLLGRDRKDTVDSLRDAVVTIFSHNVSPDERRMYARYIYLGRLREGMGNADAKHVFDTQLESGDIHSIIDGVIADVWKFCDEGQTYESIHEDHATFRAEAAKTRALANAFATRGFRIGDFIRIYVGTPGNTKSPSDFVPKK